MIKLIFFLKRKPGISAEEFRDRYENSHALLAKRYIGHLLENYVRNYPTFATLNPSNQPAGSTPAPHDIGYDAIAEMWVKDEAALNEVSRIFNDPEINPILVEDELTFLDRDHTVMIICDEVSNGTRLAG